MNELIDKNNPGIKQGDIVCGYVLKRIVKLQQEGSFFYEFNHEATGARHIHISSNDSENVFSVGFKTVPKDSTGVAHILEHTVLCGSKKFPVRDPFFSMLKRSMNTFMNAFTGPDWTMYPFSTQNKNDYYNLMDVYLDSVFYPEMRELSFKQEGHRLEIEGKPDRDNLLNEDDFRLEYKGVVYNEMQGAMSSPHEVLARNLLKAIYPSITYAYNSGGDPAVIPALTYEQLKDFHHSHYHPSNAFFFTFGDFPLQEHLAFIGERVLTAFNRIDPGTNVPNQPRWSEPKSVLCGYPFDENEDPSKKCQVCMAWLTADINDSYEVLLLKILERVLLGNPASPLRKALIDSELGSAICDGAGYDADYRDTMFAAGLKDVEASAAEKIEEIIFNVLGELSENGVNKKHIESAIHQIEFHRKEITNIPYPYGIKLLLTFLGSWFHGGDPLHILNFDDNLNRLRTELKDDRPFEKRIQNYFLENTHRVLFSLLPDQQMGKKETERVRSELSDIKEGLSQSDIKKIINDAKALKKLQDDKEDVSCLPTLGLDEIPPEVVCINESDDYQSIPALCYNQQTSDIFYFSAVAGTGVLPERLIPLVPFFCYTLTKVGTAIRDYTEMTQLIDEYTGGIGLSAFAGTRYSDTGECVPFIGFNGKCLARNQKEMFEIIQELASEFDFSDQARLKSLLLEYRAGLESRVIPNGHRLAMLLASRNFSQSCLLKETWQGIHQLQTIKRLADGLTPDRIKMISDDLQSIGGTLFNRENFKIAIIGDEPMLSASADAIGDIKKCLGEKKEKVSDKRIETDGFGPPDIELSGEIPREGWSTTSAVSFVAQAFETVKMSHEDAPALAVISKMLRSLFLHREIREKGGAYGGFALYNTEDGIFSFGSYRDPHIVSTLQTYKDAGAFITSGDYTDEDIKEAILQICSDIDKPDPPGIAARNAFYRKIIDLSDDTRKAFKKKLLSITRSIVMDTAMKYFSEDHAKHGIAVISNKEKLKSANDKLNGDFLKLYKI
ncbi:MAG: insulinase family protein [Deltaproteobacteria bacterium]|nr:insulinase family protein [Deltaproteobacteria bacterium]